VYPGNVYSMVEDVDDVVAYENHPCEKMRMVRC
jgi:hypothetical protein